MFIFLFIIHSGSVRVSVYLKKNNKPDSRDSYVCINICKCCGVLWKPVEKNWGSEQAWASRLRRPRRRRLSSGRSGHVDWFFSHL